MKKIIFCLLTFSSLAFVRAQSINEDFEKWTVKEKAINITGMDISPDANQLALVCGKVNNNPLMIYDISSRSIVKEIEVKAEFEGYNVYYSKLGNYLLIQERKLETSIKKAKKVDYAVVDLNQEKEIIRFKKISDAKISTDESKLYVLEDEELKIYSLPELKVIEKAKLDAACNALAIHPNGSEIAVAVKPEKKDLKNVPSLRNNKKVLKKAAKFRHMIAIFDAESFEKKQLVNEVYDNINLMFYSSDGDKLTCFNAAPNSYVNVIDANNYEPLRESYLSRTNKQPDYNYGWNNKVFGIATVDEWPAVNIYDVNSGSMLDSYDTKMKIWKNMKKKIYSGTNTSFVFLPDQRHVLIAYGNSLIKWKIKQ